MPSPILKYFTFAHLPPNLQEVSKPIGELARAMDEKLPDGAEKSAGLRKLLEAKDCLVRALLPLVLLALTLGLSASPAHAAEPQQSFITKAQYEANVLPWGDGTNFVKDQDDRFWIIHKHMPPMQARVDGVPIFPLDEQMWNGVMLEHAKKKAKPVAPPAKPVKPAAKIGGDWADGFDGLISVIEQAKEAAANGDPSLLADVRANLIANRAALKPAAKQEAALGPDFAQWFKAMPLPRIIANPFRALFGR